MKKKRTQPWLTPTGVAIPMQDLIHICQSWSAQTWESYLKWYEGKLKESQLPPTSYEQRGNATDKSVFESHGHKTSSVYRRHCEHLLSILPAIEAEVLRRIFFDGQVQTKIAADLNRSQTNVSYLKRKALSRLKRENPGDNWLARPYIRGQKSPDQQKVTSIWDKNFENPILEDRPYQADDHVPEFGLIKNHSLRVALQALPERHQKILYLRFWCDQSVGEIARELATGQNIIEIVLATLVSKIKRHTLQEELNEASGGEQCA